MATVHYENKLILTMSPKELRVLADKMEKRWTKLHAGDTTFVDILHHARDDRDTMVVLHLDQQYFHDWESLPRLRKKLEAAIKADRYTEAHETEVEIQRIEKEH